MKRILSLAMVATITMAPAAFAQVSEAEFQQLREQLAAVSARLDQLEAENAELRSAQAESAAEIEKVETSVAELPASGGNWSDRVSLDGDFRYRYERIDPEGESDRQRNRIRARVNLKADVTDDIEVGFGLATGGDDPVSTNQTLGGGGSSKGVVLNLAYADWEVSDGLHLIGGKFKNPLYRPGKLPLLWDGDWTPEGFAVTYARDWYFVNAIGTFLESDTRSNSDSFAWGGQFGAKGTFGDVKLTGGIGYYSIPTKGNPTSFGSAADPGDYFGNTAVEAGTLVPCGTNQGTACEYLYDYMLTELFGEASFGIGDIPASVYFNYVNNSDASSNDTGWKLGTKLGAAKDRGDMQFTYYYADKEADSMLGLLTDSDFAGGGTDSKGHWLKFDVGINKSWVIGAQYFINEVDIASGNKSDYNRLMIDMQWKWK